MRWTSHLLCHANALAARGLETLTGPKPPSSFKQNPCAGFCQDLEYSLLYIIHIVLLFYDSKTACLFPVATPPFPAPGNMAPRLRGSSCSLLLSFPHASDLGGFSLVVLFGSSAARHLPAIPSPRPSRPSVLHAAHWNQPADQADLR